MTHPALCRHGPIASSITFDTSHPNKQQTCRTKTELKISWGLQESPPLEATQSACGTCPERKDERWPFYFLSTGLDYELQLLDDPLAQECRTDSRHINPFHSSSLRYPPITWRQQTTCCSFEIITNYVTSERFLGRTARFLERCCWWCRESCYKVTVLCHAWERVMGNWADMRWIIAKRISVKGMWERDGNDLLLILHAYWRFLGVYAVLLIGIRLVIGLFRWWIIQTKLIGLRRRYFLAASNERKIRTR